MKGGEIHESMTVLFPDSTKIYSKEHELPTLTQRDVNDIEFGVRESVDFVCISSVKDASDIQTVKKILRAKNAEDTRVLFVCLFVCSFICLYILCFFFVCVFFGVLFV